MHICIVGGGGMGSLYGGLLARSGIEVTLLDTWAEHMAAIRAHGLHLDGITGDLRIALNTATSAAEVAPADIAFIQVNTYATRAAAESAGTVLTDDGYAITLQNGIGNLELMREVLGEARVLGGLSYHSAAVRGPGHVSHTHAGPTWLGELDGGRTPRLAALDGMLKAAGFAPVMVDDIVAYIWNKFIHNSAINPICAVTGLRVGEIPRTPSADALQTRVVEEALAVVAAKGVTLPDADPMQTIKDFCKPKFNKPSMLQHIEQGKRTEIAALNGAIAREGAALGIPTPYNQALAWMVAAIETRSRPERLGAPVDYDALETELRAAALQ